MDTSTRLSFLNGDLRIPASEIEATEWVELINKALDICKPHLKYVDQFKEVKHMLNFNDGAYDRTITSRGVMRFPPEAFAETTRCLCLLSRSCHWEASAIGASKVEKKALLTQSGQWLWWVASYRQETRHGLGYRAHHTGTDQIAISSEFKIMDSTSLLREVTALENPFNLLKALSDVINGAIAEKEKVLANLKSKRERLHDVFQRIQF